MREREGEGRGCEEPREKLAGAVKKGGIKGLLGLRREEDWQVIFWNWEAHAASEVAILAAIMI